MCPLYVGRICVCISVYRFVCVYLSACVRVCVFLCVFSVLRYKKSLPTDVHLDGELWCATHTRHTLHTVCVHSTAHTTQLIHTLVQGWTWFLFQSVEYCEKQKEHDCNKRSRLEIPHISGTCVCVYASCVVISCVAVRLSLIRCGLCGCACVFVLDFLYLLTCVCS